jgi:hypothetical protein
MGSLPASGIPVVGKSSISFRKHDVRIKLTDSQNDTSSGIISYRPNLFRTITSGSIVRGDNSVEYIEDRVWGTTLMGRTTTARIASEVGNVRSVVVDLAGNETTVVIESGLVPNIPQLAHKSLGERIQENQSVGNLVTRRILSSGLY